MTQQEALFKYILRLGDNALILGHRLGECCGKAPILEEDLALTNIALDLIGRAESLLRYAAIHENKGRNENDLAYKRPEREFYNFQLLEQPNTDFAFVITRQFLNSAYELFYYQVLMSSQGKTLSSIAAKSIKEIRYHWKHSSEWVIRLGNGTEESISRMQNALNSLWMFTGEFFESDEIDEMMHEFGIGPDPSSIRGAWRSMINKVLYQTELKTPEDSFMQSGSKRGLHTEKLGYILAEMQYLPRAYPDAKW